MFRQILLYKCFSRRKIANIKVDKISIMGSLMCCLSSMISYNRIACF